MRKFFIVAFLIFCLVFSYSYAIEENSTYMFSGESGEIQTQSGEAMSDEILSGEEKTEKLPEEGASVDTSVTEKNYTVEAPTIILLSLFGVLVIISLILIIMKI